MPNPMNITTPVPGTTPGPEWASQINDIITEQIATHNHQPAQDGGVALTQAALNINGNLPLNNNGLIGASEVRFNTQATTPLNVNTLQTYNGNLLFKDGNGNNIQITNAGGLNINVNGGINGLAGSDGTATYGTPAGTFTWKKTSGTQYATTQTGPVQVFNASLTNPAFSVALVNANTLSANKTLALSPENLTLPQTLPVSTGRMTLSPAGVMSSVPTATQGDFACSNVAWDATPTNRLSNTSATYTPRGNKVLITLEGSSDGGLVMQNAGNTPTTAIRAFIEVRINGVNIGSYSYFSHDPNTSGGFGNVVAPGISLVWTPASTGTALSVQLICYRLTNATIVYLTGMRLKLTDI